MREGIQILQTCQNLSLNFPLHLPFAQQICQEIPDLNTATPVEESKYEH